MIKGQILITTLLALTIITLLVASLTIIAGRDVIQLANSERYEQFYNIAESEIKEYISSIGISQNLETHFIAGECLSPSLCQKSINSIFTPENISTQTLLTVRDTWEIKNIEVKKDNPFEIKLNNNYNGTITFQWEYDTSVVQVAFEIALLVDNGSSKEVLRDVYNPSTAMNEIGVSGVLFPLGMPEQDKTRFSLDLSAIGSNKLSLWVTPRIISPGVATDIILLKEVTFSDTSNVPLQIREYIAQTSETGNLSSPVVNVVSRIPLTPQIGSLFDYVLLTDGQLKIQ